jgi:hypothetical protein
MPDVKARRIQGCRLWVERLTFNKTGHHRRCNQRIRLFYKTILFGPANMPMPEVLKFFFTLIPYYYQSVTANSSEATKERRLILDQDQGKYVAICTIKCTGQSEDALASLRVSRCDDQ